MTKITRKTLWIWSFAFVLLVCVVASGIVIASVLGGFLMDDEGAISLCDEQQTPISVPESGVQEDEPKTSEPSSVPNDAEMQDPEAEDQQGTATVPPVSTQIRDPGQGNAGFEAGDEHTVWTTDTKVEIFRVSYENGEQTVTVHSGNGQKIIAPGTENSYTFKLKNTGTTTLDYTVEIDAYFSHDDLEIPVKGRLNRYDGEWIVGGEEEYASVSVLDAAEDADTLGAGKYTYYTLDWVWPFESGDDGLDTMLGNLAVNEDLVFTIEIKTTASESDGEGGGITPPQTGDQTPLWITLAVLSALAMIILVVYRKKRIVV